MEKRFVVIRSAQSGVWFGELVEEMLAIKTVRLRNARKIHQWEKAAATSGIAIDGVGGNTRICAPVDGVSTIGDVCEILPATARAAGNLSDFPPWTAK